MRVLCYPKPRHAKIVDAEEVTPGAGEFVARSLFCDISAGTEMGFYRGTAPQFHCVGNSLGNFDDRENTMVYPMHSNAPGTWWMGYSNIAEVTALGAGVSAVQVGDRVFSYSPHQSMQKLSEKGGFVKLAPGADPENAAMGALAGIALNGILDASLRLKENVVVIGLGPLGQMVTAMAKRSGARVIAVDCIAGRLETAKTLGADEAIDFRQTNDLAGDVFRLCGGRGADAAIEVSGNIAALTSAMRVVAPCARVVALSFYADGAPALNLGREFHHKHLNLISSQIGNLNPSLVTWWTPMRRLQAALELAEELQLKRLFTHHVGFEELPAALEMIDQRPAECGAVCIDYAK